MFNKRVYFFSLLLVIILFLGACSLTPPIVVTHTITAISGEHGSINPEGKIEVTAGRNKSFNIIADDEYTISDILVDGISILPEKNSVGPVYNYVFINVQKDHKIEATFTKEIIPPSPDPVVTRYTVRFLDWDNTVLSSQSVKHGDAAIAPTETPTRKGYDFIGWDPADFSRITRDLDIKAVYEQKIYKLYIAITGSGTGSTEPQELIYHSYYSGTDIDVTAAPANECSYFEKWSGDVESTDIAITVTMDSDINLTAHFSKRTVYNINKNKDYSTIQGAIDDANQNDEIVVCPGTYFEKINYKGKNIVLRSSSPDDPAVVESTIIDGGNNGSVATFVNSETAGAKLIGFTIQNGNSDLGGGIYIENSSPSIQGNNIIDNVADYYGGGLYMTGSSATISENNFSGNYSGNDGGGLYMTGSSATISENNFLDNNSTRYGAGIYVRNSTATNITENIVKGNSVTAITGDGKGGGIMIHTSSVFISGNEISENTASTNGGGIYIFNGLSPSSISGNQISDNVADYYGGGVYIEDSVLDIDNDNIITGNEAMLGGGIYLSDCSPDITENTIKENIASNHGGGLYLVNSSPTISENKIAENSASYDGGGIYLYQYSTPKITDNEISDNIAKRFGGGILVSQNSDIYPTTSRPTGWGSSMDTDYRTNIPIDNSTPLEPVAGPANNSFSGNRHGDSQIYSSGAHVLFFP